MFIFIYVHVIHCLAHLYIFHCSFAYSHRNLFGRNQKLHISLERGQIDSIFRINYTDPWVAGDDKRTSRMIMVQVVMGLFLSNIFSFLLFLLTFIDDYCFVRIQEHPEHLFMVTNMMVVT